MPQRRKRLRCFFSTWKTVTHILFVPAPPRLKDVLPFRKNCYVYSFQDKGFRTSKKKTAHVFFSSWKKGNGSSAFLYLKKPLRICFSLTRPCLLKMYFRLEKIVTHIRFKINFPDKGFRATKKKPLLLKLNLVDNGDKWIRCFFNFFIDQIKNTFRPYKYMNNIKLQAKKDKRSIQNLWTRVINEKFRKNCLRH